MTSYVTHRRTGLLSVVVAFAAASISWGLDAPPPAPDASVARTELIKIVNAEFNLDASVVAALLVDHAPGIAQRISVPLGDIAYTLEVWPHSVRSEHYEVKYQLPDGGLMVVEPGPERTVRGIVGELQGAVVAGSVMDDGLLAVVVMPDGERWWIEPIASRVAGAALGDHVVYRDMDVIAPNGSCGVNEAGMAPMRGLGPLPEGTGCNGSPCVAELACDSDVEYFNRWGNNVEARINSVTNTMNMQYEDEVGITHVITTIIVRPTEPDPYDSSNNNILLGQFQGFWLANMQNVVRDVAELFTGRNITGGVIGTALTIGGICTNNAYCFVESDFNNVFSCATDLSAHELGHLWGGAHCNCPGLTMNPSITCANQFGDPTVPSIIAHRNSRTCLSDFAPATAFPFNDGFTSTVLDPALWLAEGATADDVGIGEPSAPFSMRINGDDSPTTGFMNADDLERVAVRYWWQRTGGGGSPDLNEDLVLEYLRAVGSFAEVDRQVGEPAGGGDGLPYAERCLTLPQDATHDGLQIRFRMIGGESNDDFFVDNVQVIDGAEVLNVAMQPQFGCACLGGSAEFSVVAGGEAPFTYQWRRNNVIIPGATGDTLMISPIQASDFTTYTVDVSNICGTIRSQPAELFQSTAPSFSLQPQDTTLFPGETLGQFVSVSGNCLEYQWYFNDEPIAGANSSFLFIPDIQCPNQGCYHVEATNDCGTTVSDIAEVTVDGCGPLNCSTTDTIAPVVLHQSGLQGQTRPYTGYIDPRRESTNGAAFNSGITQLEILFSEPVQHVGGGALALDSFLVTQTGGAAPPTVVAVDESAMPLVEVTLSRPITLRQWTTIQAVVQDAAPTPNMIINAGNQGPGVNEADRVDIAFLPADTNQSAGVNPLDLLSFKQYVNGSVTPAIGTVIDFVDTDRNGVLNPLDLLAFKRLVNGVIPSTQAWAGATLLSARP